MLFSVLWNMNVQIECWLMLILCYFLHQPNNLLQLWASGAMRSWLLGWSLSLLSFVCILYSLHLILWDLSILYTFLLPKVFYFLFWLIFYSFLLLLGIYLSHWGYCLLLNLKGNLSIVYFFRVPCFHPCFPSNTLHMLGGLLIFQWGTDKIRSPGSVEKKSLIFFLENVLMHSFL